MDYKAAGVDMSAADLAKDKIKGLARGTVNAGVLSEIGAFGGMFRPDLRRYQEPVLVASTDGVGTKIRVAVMAGIHDTVGYDLVAHCVNDILVQGVCRCSSSTTSHWAEWIRSEWRPSFPALRAPAASSAAR